jgi:hypothetical protein
VRQHGVPRFVTRFFFWIPFWNQTKRAKVPVERADLAASPTGSSATGPRPLRFPSPNCVIGLVYPPPSWPETAPREELWWICARVTQRADAAHTYLLASHRPRSIACGTPRARSTRPHCQRDANLPPLVSRVFTLHYLSRDCPGQNTPLSRTPRDLKRRSIRGGTSKDQVPDRKAVREPHDVGRHHPGREIESRRVGHDAHRQVV